MSKVGMQILNALHDFKAQLIENHKIPSDTHQERMSEWLNGPVLDLRTMLLTCLRKAI